MKPVRHPIRNWASSDLMQYLKLEKENEAVLRAGAYDIQRKI